MNKNALVNKLTELIEPVVESKGYELYFLEYVKESNEYYLRIYIDKEDGITLTDCEEVSRAVSDLLDVEDPIEDAYYLEVSSPGIERILVTDKHFARYINNEIQLKLTAPIEKKKQLEGKLLGFDADSIELESDGKEISIPRDKIKLANLKGVF